ncbi:hypothetical protein LMG23994_07013 [Cupriavidus pinatubonensis]|uniref:Uncharacterized protein n=1 Tax=Cupriavidus pinatubonensis TaxID=248026 RepID=A0ABM8Y485_9BURK|nr:hypothetical protein LMG23994_07013 [Cupriavidus pinatubonensis]
MQAQRPHIKAFSLELGYFGDGGWHAALALHYELQADTYGRPPPVEAAATSLPLELSQSIIDGRTVKATIQPSQPPVERKRPRNGVLVL